MVNYSQFNVSGDTALNIRTALSYCKENDEDILVFPKSTYIINKKYAQERWLSVSNHGNGLRRIAFLLDGFKNFTIDFSGSTLIMEDIIMPFALMYCENVHIKNFKIENMVQLSSEGVITKVDSEGFSFKHTAGSPVYVKDGKLRGGSEDGVNDTLSWANEWRKDGWFSEKYSDLPMDRFYFSCEEDGTYKASGGDGRTPLMEVGNKISFLQRHRVSCGVFMESSLNTVISNYTIYNGIGMGLIAQNCDTVTVDSMKVIPKEGRCFSINADATHFVHCRGLIHIKDSFFEGQLDDALNVHGIYLNVYDKTENSVILKFMHPEALGIDCVKEGFVMESCDPESLIPKKRYKVKKVNKINIEYIEVFFEEGIDDIKIGDDMTEVSYVCDVLFENCTVRNNRARGMLLASGGKTVIRNNVFKTPGAAVKFESDGAYWFESGGVKDVLITGNSFDNCLYVQGAWGSRGIIDVMKRKKIDEGKYFHKKIEISDNVFKNCKKPLASVNNTEHFIFKNNVTENCTDCEIISEYIGKKEL